MTKNNTKDFFFQPKKKKNLPHFSNFFPSLKIASGKNIFCKFTQNVSDFCVYLTKMTKKKYYDPD